MIIIYTRERAEKLATWYEQMGFTVNRWVLKRSVTSRQYHGIVINSGIYAQVTKRNVQIANITYEWIDEGSVIW